jgi:hypothetical protein
MGVRAKLGRSMLRPYRPGVSIASAVAIRIRSRVLSKSYLFVERFS